MLGFLFCTIFLSGCAKLELKDGGISFGKDTSATMDELGVGVIKNKF